MTPPRLQRLGNGPLITPDMLPGNDGENINGPSMIRRPAWLKSTNGVGPLEDFLLYFAHHGGDYIRLATASKPTGPWRIIPGGSLRLDQAACESHIASPDVHIDQTHRQIVMYFHGVLWTDGKPQQLTYRATSVDGVNFQAEPKPLGSFYLRAFLHHGQWFGITKGGKGGGGQLVVSPDGVSPFETTQDAFLPGMRHAAVRKRGDILEVYYSRIGDMPERIVYVEVPLAGRPEQWQPTEPITVLKPELPWEGVNAPQEASESGLAKSHVHQLRDPGVFTDIDGRAYLWYSTAGEEALALAEIFDG